MLMPRAPSGPSNGAAPLEMACRMGLYSPASCSPKEGGKKQTPHAIPASSCSAHVPAWAAVTGPSSERQGKAHRTGLLASASNVVPITPPPSPGVNPASTAAQGLHN